MDPLAKPEWPLIQAQKAEAILALLSSEVSVLGVANASNSSDTLIGFNSTMAGLEEHIRGGRKLSAIFVCRSDVPASLSQPFALASAATHLPLIALPKGSRSKLSDACNKTFDTIALATRDHQALNELVQGIDPAKASWACIPGI